ncbi:hypothetical protein AB8S08_07750 [Pseudidiomarina sp. PP-1MA]|uniref:DoxX-like family protein n=1 Tax=Pseudidiomarina sp. PP-1MA TaxID=3237706 RepID=A0AB39X4N1_9GAMM
MALTTRLVILAGLIGLMFYNLSDERLAALIIDYQLGWYKLGVPLAWGLVLGALLQLLGLKQLHKFLEPITFIAVCVMTVGLTGAAAIFGAHQTAILMLPALQIATIGLGVYLFAYSYARFAGARESSSTATGKDE